MVAYRTKEICGDLFADFKIGKYAYCHEKSIGLNRNQEAFINIGKFEGRMLLISAEKDNYWPCRPMCDLLVEKGNRKNISHIFLNTEHSAKTLHNEVVGNEIINFLNEGGRI